MYKSQHQLYNLQEAMYGVLPDTGKQTPEDLQCACFIHEQTNLMECKTLCLKNAECVVYITPEIRTVLSRFSPACINKVVQDGSHFGVRKYVFESDGVEHEFWSFKKYQVSSQYANISEYRMFAPFLTQRRKYGRFFFAKNLVFSLGLATIFTVALICSVILASELWSMAAAAVCIFIAGFVFYYMMRLFKKYRNNPFITHFDVEKALHNLHTIPSVMIVTEDNSTEL